MIAFQTTQQKVTDKIRLRYVRRKLVKGLIKNDILTY